jgi:hypothetical protein
LITATRRGRLEFDSVAARPRGSTRPVPGWRTSMTNERTRVAAPSVQLDAPLVSTGRAR